MSEVMAQAADVRRGVRLEVLTVIWMIIEAAVSLAAGIATGSALLIAFGLDSVIELVSGGILLWRLQVEANGGDTDQVERAEHVATRIVAICLVLLCLYVLLTAIYGLITHIVPETAPLGIGITLAAVIVMPYLFIAKRQVATRLDSAALRGDAASSLTCAYMAAAVLVGLVLNAVFHWWWAENIAALVFLFWLAQETREAVEEALGKEDADD